MIIEATIILKIIINFNDKSIMIINIYKYCYNYCCCFIVLIIEVTVVIMESGFHMIQNIAACLYADIRALTLQSWLHCSFIVSTHHHHQHVLVIFSGEE